MTLLILTYQVGSANVSLWKIGHANDNSADSENVAGAREPNVHAHFILVSKTVRETRSFFRSMTKIQLKRVIHKLSWRTIDALSAWRFREASSGPEKYLVQHSLVEKRQTSWRLHIKETKHERSGRRSATPDPPIVDRVCLSFTNPTFLPSCTLSLSWSSWKKYGKARKMDLGFASISSWHEWAVYCAALLHRYTPLYNPQKSRYLKLRRASAPLWRDRAFHTLVLMVS